MKQTSYCDARRKQLRTPRFSLYILWQKFTTEEARLGACVGEQFARYLCKLSARDSKSHRLQVYRILRRNLAREVVPTTRLKLTVSITRALRVHIIRKA